MLIEDKYPIECFYIEPRSIEKFLVDKAVGWSIQTVPGVQVAEMLLAELSEHNIEISDVDFIYKDKRLTFYKGDISNSFLRIACETQRTRFGGLAWKDFRVEVKVNS